MEQELSLGPFFELSDEPMLVSDKFGMVLACNDFLNNLLPEAVKSEGLTVINLVHEDDREFVENCLASIGVDNVTSTTTARLSTTLKKDVYIAWSIKYDTKTGNLFWIGKNVSGFKQQELFLNILEEVTGTGVWELASDGDVAHWSPKIHQIHETDKDTYVPVIDKALSFYPEKALPVLLDCLEKQEKTGEPYNINLPFVTAKGNDIMVNARGFTETREGVVLRRYGTFKNVTEELAEQLEKKKLDQRMALALELSRIGVWEFDLKTQALIWDDNMVQVYGVQKESLSGTFDDWANLVHPDDFEKANADFKYSVESDELFISQFRIITPSGEVRHIKAAATNIYDNEGNITQVVGVNMDVTSEVEKRRLLEEAKEKSDAATQAKSQFLANMSHEIRTPLNGIMGGLQILLEETLSKHGRDIAEKSLESAKSLLGIINDILDYTKIDEGKIELEFIPVDVCQLVKQIVNEQALLNPKKLDVEFVLTFDKSAEGEFKADPTRLRQIISNLLNNAIKFTNNGEVAVHLSEAENNHLLLTIKDSGIGMSQRQIDKLFTPFVQADASVTRKYGGTGLGLSIVKQLTLLMHGEIKVESQLGEGSCFMLSFPFERVSNHDSGHPSAEESSAPDLTGLRILVAEDNELNQILIGAMLADTGADLEIVDDGESLLRALNEEPCDLVLCDINMPGMGGIEACRHIRHTDKETPLYAFTANVMKEDIAHYLDVGFDGVISKPVIKGDLFKTLKSVKALRHKA